MTDSRNNIVKDVEGIRQVLLATKRVAVLGIRSEKDCSRPAFYVPQYLVSAGLQVIPVPVHDQNVHKILGDRIGRDIFMYSVTLRPDQDKPKDLNHYVQMHGIKPGWQFLTGKPRDIELLRRSLGFYDGNEELDKDRTNHIGMVRYGNEARQWWAMCPGQAKPAWIARSILWMDKPLYVKPENKSGDTPSKASDKGGQK